MTGPTIGAILLAGISEEGLEATAVGGDEAGYDRALATVRR